MTPETDPGTRPMVFETFAVTGGTPKARRVGNVISVPDPTTVLMVPAATPARPMATASSGDTPRRLRADYGAGGAGGGASVPEPGAAGGGWDSAEPAPSEAARGLAALAASAIAACTASFALLTSESARAPLPASLAGSMLP